MTRFIALLSIILLAGCADASAPEPQAAQEKPTLENCQRLGGTVQAVGLLQSKQCVVSYKDAGKSCTDGSQCEGDCWGEARPYKPDEPAVGKCQPTNMPFGCNSRINNGVASPVLCVD